MLIFNQISLHSVCPFWAPSSLVRLSSRCAAIQLTTVKTINGRKAIFLNSSGREGGGGGRRGKKKERNGEDWEDQGLKGKKPRT